jgi:hypothetical protein
MGCGHSFEPGTLIASGEEKPASSQYQMERLMRLPNHIGKTVAYSGWDSSFIRCFKAFSSIRKMDLPLCDSRNAPVS